MKTQNENDRTILFQIPYICPYTPAAVNIWVKNIAKAFALARFKPTIQYLCKDTFATFTTNGVRCASVSFPFAAILKTPKLRAVLFSVIQDYYLEKFGRNYSIIAPLGGPYSLANEHRKIEKVNKNGAKYLHPILEHPKVRTQYGNDRVTNYLLRIANSYDYLMPITTYLDDMFREHGRTKPSLLNPIVVDTKAIPTSGLQSSHSITNLLYCGNLGHEEEIYILLDMFSIVQKELPDAELNILEEVLLSKRLEIWLGNIKVIVLVLKHSLIFLFMGEFHIQRLLSTTRKHMLLSYQDHFANIQRQVSQRK